MKNQCQNGCHLDIDFCRLRSPCWRDFGTRLDPQNGLMLALEPLWERDTKNSQKKYLKNHAQEPFLDFGGSLKIDNTTLTTLTKNIDIAKNTPHS